MSNKILLFPDIKQNHTKKQTFWVFFSLRLLSWTRSEPLICIDLCWGTTCLINNQLQLIFHHFIWTGPLHSWENRMTNYFTNLEITNFLCCRSLLFFLFKKVKSMDFFFSYSLAVRILVCIVDNVIHFFALQFVVSEKGDWIWIFS